MKKYCSIGVVLLLAGGMKASAQLPSQRPMNQMFSARLQQQLNKPRATRPAILPSEAALPAVVTDAKRKSHNPAVTVQPGTAQQQKLPANKPRALPMTVRRPKH